MSPRAFVRRPQLQGQKLSVTQSELLWPRPSSLCLTSHPDGMTKFRHNTHVLIVDRLTHLLP